MSELLDPYVDQKTCILAFLRKVRLILVTFIQKRQTASLNVKIKISKFLNSTSLEKFVRITEYWLKLIETS